MHHQPYVRWWDKYFFSAFQKYGGSFVSFNELKIRSDLVIVIGAKQTNFSSHFYKALIGASKS